MSYVYDIEVSDETRNDLQVVAQQIGCDVVAIIGRAIKLIQANPSLVTDPVTFLIATASKDVVSKTIDWT